MSRKDIKAQEGTEMCAGINEETCRVATELGMNCPSASLLNLLSGRWSLPVLFQLTIAKGPVRFNELRRSIGRVTQKELTRTLREFESLGLVTRKIYAEIPPRVEYKLTELGITLREPLKALGQWFNDHGHQLPDRYRPTEKVLEKV